MYKNKKDMQKIMIVLMFLQPGFLGSQSVWNPLSPSEYMWQNVGNPGFSVDSADYTSLAFDMSGQPYVAYQDIANERKVTVMKFDGANWLLVSSAYRPCPEFFRATFCGLF
jgi:hypothetical protein